MRVVAQINGVDWTTPVATIHPLVYCIIKLRDNIEKSREILIAVRCHFASEIEGGLLDSSRRDDIGSLLDYETILPLTSLPFLLRVLQRDAEILGRDMISLPGLAGKAVFPF